MEKKELFTKTVQISLLESQLGFYRDYECAIATTVSLGFSEEESKEIVDKAVAENAEEIRSEFEKDDLFATLRKSAAEKRSAIDAMLGLRR